MQRKRSEALLLLLALVCCCCLIRDALAKSDDTFDRDKFDDYDLNYADGELFPLGLGCAVL